MLYMEQSLGQLARDIPGATALFHTHALDFCCAGNRTLRSALSEASMEAAPVLSALKQLQERAAQPHGTDWSQESDKALINHILLRYHAVHREQLPELIRLARRVEQVHAQRADCPHGLADHLEAMAQELDSHMRKEEMVLFPLILHGQGERAGMPIGAMRAEHDDHGDALRRLSELTQDLTAPPEACTTWRALYAGLSDFRNDLINHIHTENNILFERFVPAQVL